MVRDVENCPNCHGKVSLLENCKLLETPETSVAGLTKNSIPLSSHTFQSSSQMYETYVINHTYKFLSARLFRMVGSAYSLRLDAQESYSGRYQTSLENLHVDTDG